MSCLSYLAALGVVVDRVSRGQHEAVLRRGLLSAGSAVVTIIHAAGFASHDPDTHHLQSKQKWSMGRTMTKYVFFVVVVVGYG